MVVIGFVVIVVISGVLVMSFSVHFFVLWLVCCRRPSRNCVRTCSSSGSGIIAHFESIVLCCTIFGFRPICCSR